MSWSPPMQVLTDGNGHFIGCVYCECSPDEFNRAEFKKHCPVHGTPKRHHDPFITAIREKDEVAEVRGIDVEQATQEALNL